MERETERDTERGGEMERKKQTEREGRERVFALIDNTKKQ